MDLKMGPSNQFNGPVLFPGVHDTGDDNRNSRFYDLQDSDQKNTDYEVEAHAQHGRQDFDDKGNDVIPEDNPGLQEIHEERFPSSQLQ
jgi:hypothetical protein